MPSVLKTQVTGVLNQFRRFDYLFVCLALGFVAFKARSLDLPFYWDEAWSYAPAVKAMYESGPSLLPGSISPEISRGHPLLFYFLGGSWMHLFGVSRTSAHAFALTLSVCVLIMTYALAAKTGSRSVGISAVALLLVNELFLAQSAILLPEIQLSLFLLLSVYFYISRRMVPFILAGMCALMTKESAVILFIALAIWQGYVNFTAPRGSDERKNGWRWSGVVGLPVLIASLFFFAQWRQNGWIFYPEHLGLMSWGLRDVIYKLKLAFVDVFEAQGQIVLTYTFAYVAPVLWRGWDRRWSPLIILLYVAAIKVLWGRWPLPLPWTLAFPVLCLVAVFWIVFTRYHRTNQLRGETAAVGFIFVLGFLGFSSLNFFTDRYLVCIIPFIAVGMLLFIESAVKGYHKLVFPGIVLIILVIMAVQIGKDDRVGDTELNYADAIRVNQSLVKYCEARELQGEDIYGSYVTQVYMSDSYAGYLSQPRPFLHVDNKINDRTTFALFTNESDDPNRKKMADLDFEMVQGFVSGDVWGEVYERSTSRKKAAP